MKLREIVTKLGLEIAAGENNLDLEVTHGYVSDILSDVMAKAPRGCVWVTNQTHQNVIAIVFFKRLNAVIMAGGVEPESEALQKAIEKELPLLKSQQSAFEIVGQLFHLGVRGN